MKEHWSYALLRGDYMIEGICGFLILVFTVGMFFNPFMGLIAFTMTLYFKLAGLNPVFYHLHITRWFGILMLLLVFIRGRQEVDLKFFKNNQSRFFLLFYLIMGASLTTSIWRSSTIEQLGSFFKIAIVFFLLVILAKTTKKMIITINTMIICMLMIVVFAIRNHYLSGAVYTGERMFGAFYWALFYDPNDMALGMIILIPFLYFALFLRENFIFKILRLAIIGIFFWAMVLTQSRGGFVGMLAMLLVLWWRSKTKVQLAILGIVLLMVGWHLAPQSYRDRMMTIKIDSEAMSENDKAAISRLDAWKAGFSMMTHRFFGVGAGNFGEGFAQYRPEGSIGSLGVRRVAHNMFIEVGGETGILGFMVFCLFIVSALNSLNKSKRWLLKTSSFEEREDLIFLSDSVFVSLIGYCAAGMFLSQNYNFLLYYLVGFSIVLERLVNKHEPESLRVREPKKEHLMVGSQGGEKDDSKKWRSRAMSGKLKKVMGDQ